MTAAALTARAWGGAALTQGVVAPSADPVVLELANEALTAARSAGASYAHVRIGRYRRQQIQTRERQVAGVSDSEH